MSDIGVCWGVFLLVLDARRVVQRGGWFCFLFCFDSFICRYPATCSLKGYGSGCAAAPHGATVGFFT